MQIATSQFIIGQYVRIIGMSERLTVGAIGDDTLFLGGKWWPVWLVEEA